MNRTLPFSKHFKIITLLIFAIFASNNLFAQNLVSVPFSNGFVGDNTANNVSSNSKYLSDLGWTNIQFTQNNATFVFVAQGNDIPGTVLITDNLGIEYSIPGFVKWRAPSGGNITTPVFVPTTGATLATNSTNGSPTYVISITSYIGLTFNGDTLTIPTTTSGGTTAGEVSGNAATSGVLDALNAYLGSTPQTTLTFATPLTAFSKCNGIASADQTFTVSGSSLSADVTIAALTGYEYSLDGTTYSTTLLLDKFEVTEPGVTVYVRMTAGSIGTPSGDILVSTTGAITKNIAVSGTSNTVPQPLTITNSLCAANGLDWVTWDTITSTTATGTMNGIGVTVTQSNPGLGETAVMFNHIAFPPQYNVPSGRTIKNQKAGTFTINFAQPINNPQVAFSSIGNPSTTVGITTSVSYSVIWDGAGMTHPTSTTMTGAEGFTIVSFPGLHSSITMTYDTDEVYANIAFGAENANCYNPTICEGETITLTAAGGTTYKWSPSTGLSGTDTASVIATPTVTTTYSVIDTSDACAVANTIKVTVNPAPTAPTASNLQVFCPGDTVANLTATVASGTLAWYTSETGGTSLAPTDALVAGNYYVAAGNGTCESARLLVVAATNNALSFDGINDFVTFSGTSIPDGATDFTIEAWIKPSASNFDGQYHAVLGNQTGGSANTRNPSFYLKDGKIHIDSYEDGTLTRFDFLTTNATISQDLWNHIALVKEGTTYKVYVNGSFSFSVAAPANVNITGPYNLGYIDNYFAGLIDEVRFWSTARTASEISNNMDVYLSGTETGLVDYYNFNQGVRNGNNAGLNTIYDFTETKNDGLQSNFSLTGNSSNYVAGYFAQIQSTSSSYTVATGSTLQLPRGGKWTPRSIYKAFK